MSSGSWQRNTFDWQALREEYRRACKALGDRITIRLGVELGEAPRDFAYAEELLRQMAPVDFIIGSVHQLSEAYGCRDLSYTASRDPELSRAQIADYLELVLRQAKWGKFSVLGHLTLPLRYINEKCGGCMTFDGFEAEVAEVYRALIENGCGIEVNTNRGNTPLPGEKWLRLYRACGGEIITIGSDAHTPVYVGCCVRERQALLRECGFRAFCTFQAQKPVFHDL
jgi:histidinol-phosphatase (PHP family)